MGITTREELGGAIRKLRRSTPITEQFNTTLEATRRTAARNGTQKQIWLRWLASYDGPGPYARRRWDRSASFIYNRIAHPTLLLWLAEAAGISTPSIAAAAREALNSNPAYPSRCAAIRRVIPWQAIELALERIPKR